MSSPSQPPADRRLSADDALPPVEPPTAGFIIQLFVVPAVIVFCIVVVYVLFTWLARMGEDPSQYVEQIERNNANSWQAAHNLAMELHRNPELKQNEELAQRIARLLETKLDEPLPAGRSRENEIHLRVFLAKSLGEFELPVGFPVLIEAVETQDGDDEDKIRRAAIDGLALLSSHVPENYQAAKEHPQLVKELQGIAEREEVHLAVPAVYALGVIGGDAALAFLERELDSAERDVRFNAALGLARHGRASSVPVLEEMLDPNLDVPEEDAAYRDDKRALIMLNALRATQQLAGQVEGSALGSLQDRLEDLKDAENMPELPANYRRSIDEEAAAALEAITTASAG